MADKMLIDASHAEETRVVVVRGNRIEEFDFESEHKKQIRGNIYLAKVTRVEPSLQAAFVDYGGNRHGFLAFAEIHPDYYQIPLADRQALLKAEAEDARRERDDDFEPVETAPMRPQPVETVAEIAESSEAVEVSDVVVTEDAPAEEPAAAGEAVAEETVAEAPAAEDEAPKKPKRVRKPRAKKAAPVDEAAADAAPAEATDGADAADTGGDETPGEMAMAVDLDDDTVSERVGKQRGRRRRDDDEDEEEEVIESVGAEDAMEEVPDRHVRKPRKQYRIQEVIKRRQILLVQVAKEERGNKGAALTTYLSLAGRYSVLMPNTARGGGISRKITNLQDRKRLKEIARELEVPLGMGVILRTAGANRTKVEIKRDFEYLMRLWENVRTLTLASTAPCLVYEEGSLIKRSIRDLYNKDIGEIIVAGEEGYREAKSFMKMLMPSHAKVVQPYRDVHPIFSRSGIEAQLDRMLQPQVTLKSGGYIIINQTEALVSIDVNSGRSTREHSIEDTALQTNLEAAEEVARQLRLRDLAGLIVIDFIDMEEKRNNRSVEKKLKDCLKNDRARIQVGRISHFGLLEMSRQRIRASVLESTMQTCPHCNGTGHIRSQSSVALHVLRGIEEYLLKNTTHNIAVRTIPEIALYLLNHKRGTIIDYENRFGVEIIIEADAHVGASHFAIDRGEAVENPVKIEQIITFEPDEEDDDIVIEDEIDEEAEQAPAERSERSERSERPERAAEGDDANGRKRKRRRRRRGGRNGGNGEGQASGHDDENGSDEDGDDAADEASEGAGDGEEPIAASADASNGDGEQRRKRRRRGKRGGRRNRPEGEEGAVSAAGEEGDSDEGEDDESEAAAAGVAEDEARADAVSEVTEVAREESAVEGESEQPVAKPRRGRRKAAGSEAQAEAEVVAAPQAVAEAPVEVAPLAAPASAEPADAVTDETVAEAEEARPQRANRDIENIASEPVIKSSTAGSDDGDAGKPKKGGWWQRRGFF
ncbi:RNAse E [Rhizobium sp. RU20A]|uniref:Rne/Rng family ribonuclease n=1 Tax=Rhizobium sp. RU20A TaxID=1907412 RepID=UPI0009549EEB|nr:ribonuclease E/G [Rhizobium sp. RU20A]SIP98880.1 RNAse E [Rhizobium sp. RU20A]